ncbi:hypothetical protein FPG87_02400 [Flavobacterium psychrophilum]|nr:hypothetical protein FPG87_02400 [Flavobacterium psychrophilum]
MFFKEKNKRISTSIGAKLVFRFWALLKILGFIWLCFFMYIIYKKQRNLKKKQIKKDCFICSLVSPVLLFITSKKNLGNKNLSKNQHQN